MVGRKHPKCYKPRANFMEPNMNEFNRWEGRFASPDYVFGTAPNQFLVRCQPLLPRAGTALAIADGEGRNGVWLAQQGLDVLSIDFSPSAQAKAKRLAALRGVTLRCAEVDLSTFDWPHQCFDVVADIFTQFTPPPQRAAKWAGVRHALKPGGLIIMQGYNVRQIDYGTGGPSDPAHLYTRAMVEAAFADWHDVHIIEEDVMIDEGSGHSGMSALIGLTARS